MSKRAKKAPGPPSDEALVAKAERAATMRPVVQESLRKALGAADAKVADGQEIPFSWLGYIGKLLSDERDGAMWDTADGGDEDSPAR